MPKRKRPSSAKSAQDERHKSALDKKDRTILDDGEVWSKSKKKRMRKLRSKQHGKDTSFSRPTKHPKHDSSNNNNGKNSKVNQKGKRSETSSSSSSASAAKETSVSVARKHGKQSTLQASFRARLAGSRFRELNEVSQTREKQTLPPSCGALFQPFSHGHRTKDTVHNVFGKIVQNVLYQPRAL